MALTKKTPTCDKQPRFPLYLVTLSRSKASRQLLRSISEKVAKKCFVSPQEALMDYIPVLHFIFQRNASMAADLAIWFELFKLEPGKTKVKISWTPEIEFLAGSKDRAKKIQALIKKRIKEYDLSKHEAVEAFTFASEKPQVERGGEPSSKKNKLDIDDQRLPVASVTTETTPSSEEEITESMASQPSTEKVGMGTVETTAEEIAEDSPIGTSPRKKNKKKKSQKSLTDFFG